MNTQSTRVSRPSRRAVIAVAVVLACAALAASPVWAAGSLGGAGAAGTQVAQAEDEDGGAGAATAASLHVEPAIANLRDQEEETGIWLMGAGLEPGQDIWIYVHMMGIESDISAMLDGDPVVNDEGAFAISWEIDVSRFGNLFADRLTVQLRDPGSGGLLATAPVAVCPVDEDAEAPWCAAAQDLLPR